MLSNRMLNELSDDKGEIGPEPHQVLQVAQDLSGDKEVFFRNGDKEVCAADEASYPPARGDRQPVPPAARRARAATPGT